MRISLFAASRIRAFLNLSSCASASRMPLAPCAQIVPVTFSIDALDLGYLDENTGSKSVRCSFEFLFPFLNPSRHALRATCCLCFVSRPASRRHHGRSSVLVGWRSGHAQYGPGRCCAIFCALGISPPPLTGILFRSLGRRSADQMSLPKFLHPSFRISLLADPTCVDLCSRCPYFYEIGSKIASMYDCAFHSSAYRSASLRIW